MSAFITNYKTYLLFSILLALIYFPIFLHLTSLPIRMWDESIMGTNAVEMGANHNFIVTYSLGSPDMMNCKPPLMIWCIVLFSKIFGFSELSLRLPSALAALGLCIYLFFLLKQKTGGPVFGFFTVLVLVTCQGYIRNHVTRTGEYDSLLVLFSTISSLHLFFACEAEAKKEQSRYLLGFFIFLTLAVLTKGIAPLMMGPGLFIYVLIQKKVKAFLTDRAFFIGFAIFILFGLGYYFLRETINPGYIKAVWENELGGRFGGSLDGHHGSVALYLNEIVTWQFVEYMFVFPIALIIGAFFSTPLIRRLVLFSSISGGMFLVIISIAATKLPHYDAPLFPFLSIITASFFYYIYSVIKDNLKITYQLITASVISFVILLAIFMKPYNDIIAKVYFPKGDYWEESFTTTCKYFQYAVQGRIKEGNAKLVFDPEPIGPGTVLHCYQQELKEHNLNNEIVRHDEVRINDTIIVFDDYLKLLIEKKYLTEELHQLPQCNGHVIYIKSEK